MEYNFDYVLIGSTVSEWQCVSFICTEKEQVALFRKISASNEKLLGEAFRKFLLLELLKHYQTTLLLFDENICDKVKNQDMYDVAREILWEGSRCSVSSSGNFWCFVFVKKS